MKQATQTATDDGSIPIMNGSIDLAIVDHVATITLNRPDKHNAITPAMAKALGEHCQRVDAGDDVRVVVVRGAGERAFSAGSDINALAQWKSMWEFRNRVEYAAVIRDIRKPVIAQLRGWVLGGGLEMALAADIRVAAASTKLGAPEVRRGWIGGGGASQMLPRLAGLGAAMSMLLTGDNWTAEQAFSRGIVDEVVADDALDDRVAVLARTIASHSPIATQAVKAAVRASLSSTLEQGLHYENELHVVTMHTSDAREGMEAFAEKREARFEGR